MTPSLEEELDRLYQRPLEEFVAARNALAKTLEDAGETQVSKEVKALAKPSASAWAVNQLYFRARDVFDRLIEAGDACRRAQSEMLAGGGAEALVKAEEDRGEAVEKARRRIAFLLSEGRLPSGPAVLRRVSTTLEALASFGSANPEPWNGRGSHDLEAPGFRALSGLPVPSGAVPPAPSAAPRMDDEAKARAKAKARLREAESALETARAALGAAEGRAERLRGEVEALRGRVARVESDLLGAEADVDRARVRLHEKRAQLEDAREKSGGDGAR